MSETITNASRRSGSDACAGITHQFRPGDRFQHRGFPRPGKVDQDVVDLAANRRLAEHVGEIVAIDRLNRKAGNVGLTPPALQRPVLVENIMSALRAAGIEIKDADMIEDGRRLRGPELGQGRT
jgi:hypothetical protein